MSTWSPCTVHDIDIDDIQEYEPSEPPWRTLSSDGRLMGIAGEWYARRLARVLVGRAEPTSGTWAEAREEVELADSARQRRPVRADSLGEMHRAMRAEREPLLQAIRDYVSEHPGCRRAEIAEAVGLTPERISQWSTRALLRGVELRDGRWWPL